MSQYAAALEALGIDSCEAEQLKQIAWHPSRLPCILVWGSGTTVVERLRSKRLVRVLREYPRGKCTEWMCEPTTAGRLTLDAVQLAKHHDQQKGIMP